MSFQQSIFNGLCHTMPKAITENWYIKHSQKPCFGAAWELTRLIVYTFPIESIE